MEQKNRLLLIDDEEDILRVLSMSLKMDGYEVETAHSGKLGVEFFQKNGHDIVITDLKMPGIDGLEVLKRIKTINPDAEIIVITGHGDMDSAIESLRYGASDFINKPVRDEALRIAIERAQEKICIRDKLKAYTTDLENMCQIAIGEVKRKSDFQDKLIRSSNDGIVATDEEGEIIIFNPGAERIFGYSRLEVVRKMTLEKLYPADLAEAFRQGFRRKRNRKGWGWKEISIVSKEGIEVPTQFSGTLLHENGTVIGSVGFFQDLREIKRLQQELVNSERLAAIGQTVARLAHYIKNILTGLKGGAYIVNIGLDKGDTDKLRTGWDMVQRNVWRVSSLVADLLSYSKERQPHYANCLPNDIAEDVCELMEMEASKHRVQLIREFSAEIEEVSMDSDAVHRVLLNLVSNAVDACVFDLDMDKQHQVKVRTVLDETRNMIRFDVADNGCGMTEEVRKKLFTAFFSTKGGKGTGLGLLVTQKLIHEHGGIVEVDSRQGEGSTFTVRLPYRKSS